MYGLVGPVRLCKVLNKIDILKKEKICRSSAKTSSKAARAFHAMFFRIVWRITNEHSWKGATTRKEDVWRPSKRGIANWPVLAAVLYEEIDIQTEYAVIHDVFVSATLQQQGGCPITSSKNIQGVILHEKLSQKYRIQFVYLRFYLSEFILVRLSFKINDNVIAENMAS
ncbi:hypothetical protein M0804_008920 [Polistes exclamans]|nr:hypothetical protein M0804_008920 [Polistes exclamans]